MAFLLGILPSCALLGVEPDEIDVLDGDTEGAAEAGEAGETGEGNTTDSDSMTDSGQTSSGPGDGDGDPAAGDGDGDDSGDTDPGGDGDGDTSGDTSGDGDGDGDPCGPLGAIAAVDGANLVEIPDEASQLEFDECGAPGPEQVFEYTASDAGLVRFEYGDNTGEAAVYLLAPVCDPLEVLDCALAPEAPELMMMAGDSVYVVVDSLAGANAGTLTITIN